MTSTTSKRLSTINYYRRDGSPYAEMLEWAKDFEKGNRRVGGTKLLNRVWISTIWLGLDHSFGTGPPLIFESMAFFRSRSDIDCERYATEEAALKGHEKMVQRWRWKGWILWLTFWR